MSVQAFYVWTCDFCHVQSDPEKSEDSPFRWGRLTAVVVLDDYGNTTKLTRDWCGRCDPRVLEEE